jgi:hypothetical protein
MAGAHRAPEGPSWPDHFTALLSERDLRDAERDRRYEQRYEASQIALTAALTADRTAVAAALAAQEKQAAAAMIAAKEAGLKTEISGEKRFELLNELRVGVATKDEIQALEKIVNSLRDEVTGMRQNGVGGNAMVARFFTVGALGLTAIGILTAVLVAVLK